ncbi:MAG: type II toxin-antitoxin system VapC family toxin [Planctomycetota bacterium]
MSFLLDTHVWIWTQEQPDAIGVKTRGLLESTREELCVSAVSSLEIARLVAGGLLEVKGSLDRWVRAAIDSIEARSVGIDHPVAIEAYKLPGRFHKDPADRILVATARINDLTLVTADERILAYRAVRTLDARR